MQLTDKQKKILQVLEQINDEKHGTEQASFSVKRYNDYYDGKLSIILEAVEKFEA